MEPDNSQKSNRYSWLNWIIETENWESESQLRISKIWKLEMQTNRYRSKNWEMFLSKLQNENILRISWKACLLFCDHRKKRYLAALRNCLNMHFHALIIRLSFNLGSEFRERNTLRLLLVCLGNGVLVVALADRQMNSLGRLCFSRLSGLQLY